MERTTLLRALAAQMTTITNPDYLQDRLVAPHPCPTLVASLGCHAVALSKTMFWHGTLVGVQDGLWFDGRFCEVQACASIDGNMYLVVLWFDFVANVTATATRWRAESADRSSRAPRLDANRPTGARAQTRTHQCTGDGCEAPTSGGGGALSKGSMSEGRGTR